MIKTRTIVSGVIALAHIILMPLTDAGLKGNSIVGLYKFDWWVVTSIVILFCLILTLMILTTEEKKVRFFSFLNTFAGVVIGCWFVFVFANNLTNLENSAKVSFLITLGYFFGLLLTGFIIGWLFDKVFKKSRL